MTVTIRAELVASTDDFVRVHGRTVKKQQVASLQGTAGDKFRAWVGWNAAIAAAAVTVGVAAGAEGLKFDLRGRIIQAGLGKRMPNAIRHEVYPGGKDSLRAAGWVFAKGRRTIDILDAYANGATIRANGARYLAIPTPEAGKAGGRWSRMTPQAWRYRRGTPLRLVAPRGKPYLLLVTRLRMSKGKRGGYRNPSPSALKRGDFDWVVVFILVKQVDVKRRLNLDGLAQQWADNIPALIEQALPDG